MTTQDPAGPEQDERINEARRQVHRLKRFYIQLVLFTALTVIAVISHLVFGMYFWAGWPLTVWAVLLIAQALHLFPIFGLTGWLGPQWEEKKIKDYLDRR